MRLIDADALKYTRVRIFHGMLDNGEPLVGGFNAVVMSCAIKDAPTVDAVPVKHGRWVNTEDRPYMIYACSLCGEKWGYGTVLHCQYCPHCGAKMKEEDNGLDQH